MPNTSVSALSAVALIFVLAGSAVAWASLGSVVMRALHAWSGT
jgi:hypothetical protein